MEFVHRPGQGQDTIAAIATPPGEGGIAIIRITGSSAIDVASKIFSGNVGSYKTHTAHYGKIHDLQGRLIDQVLLLVMLGKRSYAGEDTVEIHCHGGSLIARKILDAVVAAGARLAYPGEFTFKAFMNGKIDLAQAEAVQEVIFAKNELALDCAQSQLEGSLSSAVSSFQNQLFQIAAILEASVDFPEEGLEFATSDELIAQLRTIASEMQSLVSSFHDGKILHDGISLCLAGAPNVGKSSLMNLILDKDRAIVTPIAGTTRDTLEDTIRLNGINVRLIDTAGIREASEIVEMEGIRRSKKAISSSDLVLLVLDASKGLSGEDNALIETLPKDKTIAIWNKVDLAPKKTAPLSLKYSVEMSAKEKWGLKELHEAIDKVIWEKGPPSKEEIIITNLRHKEALQRSIDACHKVIEGLHFSTSPEFLTLDMRAALVELGTIIGTDITEDILSSIFSKFCLGK